MDVADNWEWSLVTLRANNIIFITRFGAAYPTGMPVSGTDWFKRWPATCSAPSQCLNQFWLITKCAIKNKFQWNLFESNIKLFVPEDACENVVWDMSVICSGFNVLAGISTKMVWICEFHFYALFVAKQDSEPMISCCPFFCPLPNVKKPLWLHRGSLKMDTFFHPALYSGCNYLTMLGLKLKHVCKRGVCQPASQPTNHLKPLFKTPRKAVSVINMLSLSVQEFAL